MGKRTIERNSCFGPAELGYAAVGAGSHWFAKWYPSSPPRRGYKIHVSVHAGDAEIAARSVLPKLRQHQIPHKVVRDLPRYLEQLAGEQRGKFITLYLPERTPPRELVASLDSDFVWLALRPGPAPTAPVPNTAVRAPEERLGETGFLFGRPYDEADREG
ncbi:MAG TPA: hypothetical protein VLV76_18355 [Candidatus Acidoferrum sp.]|nr:hypothetical protein [Candidatus Acidoferrum sp.]